MHKSKRSLTLGNTLQDNRISILTTCTCNLDKEVAWNTLQLEGFDMKHDHEIYVQSGLEEDEPTWVTKSLINTWKRYWNEPLFYQDIYLNLRYGLIRYPFMNCTLNAFI